MKYRKHTRYINTKELQKISFYNIMSKIIIAGVVLLFVIKAFIGEGYQLNVEGKPAEVVVWNIISGLLVYGILIGIPAVMMSSAIIKTKMKKLIENTTFPVVKDLDYFREQLSEVSPAEISMCTDLEIETEKDIAAQILQYSLDGVLDLDGDEIRMKDADRKQNVHLKASDQYLLDCLMNGKLNREAAAKWKALCEQEIISGRYLRKKKEKQKKMSAGCLPFFLVVVFGAVYFWHFNVELLLDQLLAIEEQGTLVNYLRTNPRDFLIFLGTIGIMIVFIAAIILPFAKFAKSNVTRTMKSDLERTEEGNVITEEIYGLKNFIHDFSALSDADKEKLVLWDEFLVYAVVLEENERIVKEICSMRNINFEKYAGYGRRLKQA